MSVGQDLVYRQITLRRACPDSRAIHKVGNSRSTGKGDELGTQMLLQRVASARRSSSEFITYVWRDISDRD